MKPRHHLRCLGQPALFAPTGELIRIRTKKHLALLVYLAIESRRPHRREDLAALLWPKAKPAEARHSLSTALSLFRGRLGREAVEAGREHISLRPGWITLDIDSLNRREGEDHNLPPSAIASFLDGFDIADAPDFLHWKDHQQARLLPSIKQALIAAINDHRRTGDLLKVEQIAEQILLLDDLCEEAISAALESYISRGDRISALRLYERWKTKLNSELQTEPSEALQRLAMRLRERHQINSPDITHSTETYKQGLIFVGRSEEYQTLYDHWQQTRKGLRTALLILGDSGVGKTTLVQRFRTSAVIQGAAISRAQGYEIERQVPYSLLATITNDLLAQSSASGTAPDSLIDLARITPEVRRRFPYVTESTESHGETTRIRLTEAFLDLLVAVSEQTPVLLIVDDLHFADDASLSVLHLTIRRIVTAPVMIIFVARPQEVQHSPYAIRLVEDAADLGIDKLTLNPLPKHESRHLLEALIPPEQPRPNKSAQSALLQAAAGYPMVLELLVRDWQRHGNQSLAFSIKAMSKNVTGEGEAATTYRKILRRLAASLETNESKALSLAAVLGHRLNELDMYALVDLTPQRAAIALAGLTLNQILRESDNKLEFANELVHNAAYLGIALPVRKFLHAQIARRLLQMPQAASLGLEIAWHCIRGAIPEQATIHLLAGAEEALNRGALHAAEHALVTALPHLDGADREKAVMLLVQCLQEQGRWKDSLMWLDQNREHTNSDLGTIFRLHATHYSSSHSEETIRSEVDTLIDIARTSNNPSTRVKAARVASRLLPQLREEAKALQLLRCIAMVDTSTLSGHEAIELSITQALCLYHAHRTAACSTILSHTAAQLRNTGQVNSIACSVLMGLGSIECQQGKYDDALKHFRQGHETARRIGNDSAERHTAAQAALCCCRLGAYESTLEWAAIATAGHNEGFAGYLEVQCAYYAALAHAFQGNTRQALFTVMALDDRLPRSIPEWMAQAWHFFKADMFYVSGDYRRAMSIAQQGIAAQEPKLHSRFFAGWFSRWLAHLAGNLVTRTVARHTITKLTQDLTTLDALDQVETLCAQQRIASSEWSVQEREDHHKLIQHKLQQLPPAVSIQLHAFGSI